MENDGKVGKLREVGDRLKEDGGRRGNRDELSGSCWLVGGQKRVCVLPKCDDLNVYEYAYSGVSRRNVRTSGVLVVTPKTFELWRDLKVAEKLESWANEGCTERMTSLERYAMRAAGIGMSMGEGSEKCCETTDLLLQRW